MNTISNTQSTIDVYALKKRQEAKALEQSKIQDQKKQEESDSILISQQALQTTQVAAKGSPLDSLVTAGTITQEQEDAIESAFQALMKANKPSGSETTNTRTSPLDSLVAAGTITQEQADAIESTLQTAM